MLIDDAAAAPARQQLQNFLTSTARVQLLALRLCATLLPAAGPDGRRERFADPGPAFLADLTRLATAAAIPAAGLSSADIPGDHISTSYGRQIPPNSRQPRRSATAVTSTAAEAAAEATKVVEVAVSKVGGQTEGSLWRTALRLLGRMAAAGYYADVRVVVEAAENLPQMDR